MSSLCKRSQATHLVVLHAAEVLLLHGGHGGHEALPALQLRVVQRQLCQPRRQLLHLLPGGRQLLLEAQELVCLKVCELGVLFEQGCGCLCGCWCVQAIADSNAPVAGASCA